MALRFDNLAELLAHDHDSLIDARSPAEFDIDHLPGAINLPVLNNAERAEVGTIYKQGSAFDAKKIGAAFVARNVAAHLEGPLSGKTGAWRPLVYCWRGGQRSGSFTTILKQVGWRADTICGGYQTYRRLVAAALYDRPLVHRLIALDGNTGTAKTELLHRLRGLGQQVVDLEGLAAHRGSVFGAVDRAQPSQKAFEGALAAEFAAFDPARPVLIEAESSKIGKLLIPPSLWQAMKAAPRLTIGAPVEARALYLTHAYGDILQDADALNDRLSRLVCHQGREQVAAWQALAQERQFVTLAQQLMQAHYDPSYARSRGRRAMKVLGRVEASSLDSRGLSDATKRLMSFIEKAQ